ncbi:zinc finger protein 37 homolog isoform X2 [Harmonia axyridis]|uniref:zinc finger protein 37 homolog isoform X2 n=1 Tax=Harmonia axyridis TaxID=115357 RepID=UPI001E275287|nr:zinc finger protein 37 homolog isoform X2 [Harmonia axyridis]
MTETYENDQSSKLSLCRLCANTNQNGTCIFSEEAEQNLSNLINKYLPLKVENDGKYPDKICPGCEIQLEATKLFFDLIIEGQNQLKSIFDSKNTQTIQLANLQNISGTLQVQSVETGENYFIQIMENTLTDGPLYTADHEILANMNILKKEKKKRGRPRKQLIDKKEEIINSLKNEEDGLKTDNSNNECLDDGKRQRKVPARFSETVQGKELDDILRKEGIEEEEIGSETSVKLDTEVIGRVENQNGEELEEEVIVTRVLNGNRFKRSATIPRRKRRRKFKCDKCSEEFKNYPRLRMHVEKVHLIVESNEMNDTDKLPDIEKSQAKNEYEDDSSRTLLGTCINSEFEATNDNTKDASDGNKQSLSCEQCNDLFNSEEDLIVHLESSHQNGKRFKCPECNRAFSYAKTFEMHLQRHKKGIFSCEVCLKKFNHASSLIYHRNAEHNNGKRFVCSKCNKTFKHRQLLHRHQLVHTEERPYKCNLCSSAFKTKTNLISHNYIHTGEKNYICSRCGQSFAHKTSLNLHMRWHLGEKPFTCEICDKRFSQKGNLMEHLRIHTGEKPFCCEICGRNFTTSSQLKLHTKRHTGERPWKCEYCPKTFLHKDSWKEHSRRHLNEKPFKCEICDKAFTTMYCLKKHMRFHTGFSDLSNLTKHKRVHEQKSMDNTSQNMTLLNTDADNLLYVYYETPKDQNMEVPMVDLEQAQSEVVISSGQDVLDFKGDCMHIQQLIDQEGNPLSLNTQDGQQINVVTSITNGQEKLQGLLPDGTLVALDLQDSKVENMKRLVEHVEEEPNVSHLLLDGNMTFLNDQLDKPGNDILVSEQSNICFVTYDPNA